MANHVRKQIRNAVATLVTGLPTAGARVYKSRVYDMQDANLPGLRVYLKDEASRREGASQVIARMAELVIECCAKATAPDDTIDDMTAEVETVIGNNQQAGGAKHITLVRIETELDGEGELPRTVARLVFEVLYYTYTNAPEAAL